MRFAKAVRIATLRPWGRNPRQHGDLDVQSIVRSVERFGWTNPVLVQEKTNRVIAGHGRLEAAKKAGIKTVPCVYLKLNDQDADAYTIADNKLAELSQWDEKGLSELLGELERNQYDLSLLGFTEDEINRRKRSPRSASNGDSGSIGSCAETVRTRRRSTRRHPASKLI